MESAMSTLPTENDLEQLQVAIEKLEELTTAYSGPSEWAFLEWRSSIALEHVQRLRREAAYETESRRGSVTSLSNDLGTWSAALKALNPSFRKRSVEVCESANRAIEAFHTIRSSRFATKFPALQDPSYFAGRSLLSSF
jgi:hypothetical protein